ncbi:hypothetical protein VTK73DRAFT_8675 [Phialemonium thermophilum]|uniref:Secreted protein n=1 Tax=Phialemonium thermophilum TaxID=223376 RepID=A0ABR3XNR7_9PEZI
MQNKLATVVAAALWAGCATAALSMTDVADQCADTLLFNTCWKTGLAKAQDCYKDTCQGAGTCTSENDCTSQNSDCVTDCSCIAYADMINCALAHCWNKVYGCEYQNLAVSAAKSCPAALEGDPRFNADSGWAWIPFFPSNSSQPGACSCNVAQVYLGQRQAADERATCSNATDGACDCCALSKDVSAFYDACPDTDPSAVLSDMPQFELGAFQDDRACSTMPNCSALGFRPPTKGDGTDGAFYAPGDVPANGTKTLSNGAGSVTAPPFSTITWALGSSLPNYTVHADTTGRPAQTSATSSSSPSPTHSSAVRHVGSGDAFTWYSVVALLGVVAVLL